MRLMAIYLSVATYLLLGVGCLSYGQTNLVPNPSFEDTLGCGTSSTLFGTANWFPIQSSPDRYSDLCGVLNPPPNIDNGMFQFPRTGTSFIGMSLYSQSSGGEYPCTRLIDSLEFGKKYCVEFYVNRANFSGETTLIQAAISHDTITDQHPTEFFRVFPAQISSSTGFFISDTIGWYKVSGAFIAIGGEKFITLGIFAHDSTFLSNGNNLYYYFDDVSLCHCPDSIIPTENTFSIYPNPNTGRFTIDYSIKSVSGGHVVISDMVGRKVDNIMLSPGINQANVYLPRIRAGVYHLTFIVDGQAIRTERIVLTREE